MPIPPAQRDPLESEDCLFLDVIVPETVFDQGTSNKSHKGAPVIVYIFGGGFTGGSKTASGNGAGLIESSRRDGSEEVIYMAINYRVRLHQRSPYPSNFASFR